MQSEWWNWFGRWRRRWWPQQQGGNAATLADQAQLRGLELELITAKQEIDHLRGELSRLQAQAGQAAAWQRQQLDQQWGEPFALPLAQLITQGQLLAQGQPIQSQSIWTIAQRLVTLFTDHGLEAMGQVGELVDFDPGCHQWLPPTPTTVPAKAVIRMVGIRQNGRIVQKALVTVPTPNSGS